MFSNYTCNGYTQSEKSYMVRRFLPRTTCTIMEGVGQSNVVTMATTLTSISKKNQECLKTVGLMRGSTTIHCSVSSSWNTYHQRVGGGEEEGHVMFTSMAYMSFSTLCTCMCIHMCTYICIKSA